MSGGLNAALAFDWAVGLATCRSGFNDKDVPAELWAKKSDQIPPPSPVSSSASKKRARDTIAAEGDVPEPTPKSPTSSSPSAAAPSPPPIKAPAGRTFNWVAPCAEAGAALSTNAAGTTAVHAQVYDSTT